MTERDGSGADSAISGLATEFSRLLQGIREIRQEVGDGEQATNCRQCPVCLFIGALKKEHPETLEKIDFLTSGFLSVVDSLLQTVRNNSGDDQASSPSSAGSSDEQSQSSDDQDRSRQSNDRDIRDSGKNCSRHVQRITIHPRSSDDVSANPGPAL